MFCRSSGMVRLVPLNTTSFAMPGMRFERICLYYRREILSLLCLASFTNRANLLKLIPSALLLLLLTQIIEVCFTYTSFILPRCEVYIHCYFCLCRFMSKPHMRIPPEFRVPVLQQVFVRLPDPNIVVFYSDRVSFKILSRLLFCDFFSEQDYSSILVNKYHLSVAPETPSTHPELSNISFSNSTDKSPAASIRRQIADFLCPVLILLHASRIRRHTGCSSLSSGRLQMGQAFI